MQSLKDTGTSRMEEYLNIIRDEISGQNALEYIKVISKHHRIQASPGYRAAAEDCKELLEKNGVSVEIKSYPANLRTRYFTYNLFKEWDCKEAYLDVIWPYGERLADFSKNDMSVIQRSTAADYRNRELDIVYVSDKVLPEEYKEDLSGKILFVVNGFDRWVDRAIELKACGIITVSMPEIPPVRVNVSEDRTMADKCANLSFHLFHEKYENKLFGFTLTPHGGKRLQETCINLQKEGKYAKAHAFVDSRLYDGSIENVMAHIPGYTEDEILVTAHLCHPKSSVNDNVSGVACAMEAIRSLNTLIAGGKLKKPSRTIRMVLLPEFTGTYAYLAENEHRLEEIKAGINLDMVGAKQNHEAGAFLIIDTPDAVHSFVGDFSHIMLDLVRKECPLASQGQYTGLFNSEVKPFMLGSDHYILSDPTVGIPSVALTQWPDKMYHTSGDCLEHIDSAMLYRVSSLAAGYLYGLADLNVEDANIIMYKTRERIFQRLTKLAQEAQEGKDVIQQAGYCRELAMKTCDDYRRFFSGAELSRIQMQIDREKRYFSALAELTLEAVDIDIKREWGLIPKRLFIAPLSMQSILPGLSPELQKLYKELKAAYGKCSRLDDYIIYAINGEDDEERIAGKVQYETGIECLSYVKELINFLYRLDLIIFVTGELDNDKQND